MMRRNRSTWIGMTIVIVAPAIAAADARDADTTPANPATSHELPTVTVIGTSPLSGLGLPLNYVPSNIQTLGGADLKRQQSLDLTDYLSNNFSGINISESQDNPFQPDVNYHGFTASPLLGTPEGLSIYVDGVRVNESFGDTVNWDLIPESAISTVTLISGSNPVFGLNTLGGALNVQTKSGHDNPGTELEAYGGSFGRRVFEAETGGEVGPFDYFATANYFDETGWRDLSPTKVIQAFAKGGYQTDLTDIDVSYGYADTRMIGNGTTPESMQAFRRESIYSAPDFTHNLLSFVNANGTQFLTPTLLLSGNLHFRQIITLSNNGDVNDDNYLSDDYGGPDIDCTAAPTSLLDNAYCANGINRASRLVQRTTGASVQLTESHDLFGAKNQAVVGTDFSHSTDSYIQSFQYATLTPERTAISNINPFNPAEVVNSLGGENKIFGLYITDTFSPNELFHITASARYNRNTETLQGYSVDTDVGDFPGGFNAVLPLSGDHTFTRVNPSLGFTVTPTPQLTFYANYNEGSRAPTMVELGCSNPDQPCGLPNDFASDPDLKQVVSRTFEVGVRGSVGDGPAENSLFRWSADAFNTLNQNDIQFIATTTSEGYFANVGNTRRRGLDLAVGGKIESFTWHAVYSFVDATFQSQFEVNGESNSTADENGNITVRPGARIPLIARHTARLVLAYDVLPQWDIGANVIASSGVYLHGDENNANQAGGTNGEGAFVIGSGRIGGYTLLNLNSTYHVGKALDLFVRVVNVANKHYATAGFLTSNSFNPNGTYRDDPDDWTNENATSPGQPRAAWAGARARF